MAVRVISAVVGLPFLIVIVWLGGIYLQIASVIVSLIGMYEVYKAISKQIKAVHYIGFLIEIVYMIFIHSNISENFRVILTFFILIILMMLVLFYGKINVFDAAVTLFGFFYVGFMFSNVSLVRAFNDIGQMAVWLIFICAFASDTGAYFVGINFGKHKMTPVLSPKKSIEGAIGGIASAAVVSAVFVYLYNLLYNTNINIIIITIIGAVGSVFAQMGDLAASSIKRYVNIKDYGSIMPGHGGVMDRFDSVIFTAPAIYILINLTNHII